MTRCGVRAAGLRGGRVYWRLVAHWSGAASTGVPRVLRLAGGTGPVPGWRRLASSVLVRGVRGVDGSQGLVGSRRVCQRPEFFFSVRGAPHTCMRALQTVQGLRRKRGSFKMHASMSLLTRSKTRD